MKILQTRSGYVDHRPFRGLAERGDQEVRRNSTHFLLENGVVVYLRSLGISVVRGLYDSILHGMAWGNLLCVPQESREAVVEVLGRYDRRPEFPRTLSLMALKGHQSLVVRSH